MARNKVNIFKTRAFWATTATVVLVTGVVLGAVAGYGALSRAAGANSGAQGRLSVRFNWPVHMSTPTNPDGSRRSWLPLKVQQELTDLAMENLSVNTTDGDALVATTTALEGTGWFESIQSVRRADGNAVEVIGNWRTPVAVVRVNGSVGQIDRLISAKAELLPIDYPAGTTPMRYITGPSQPAPERCGLEWDGTDVQAGLKLLAYLYNSPVYAQVSGIDVSQYASGRKLTIVTDTGGKVVWGAAPDDWSPSEPSADQKLKWLTHLKNGPEYGRRVDAGRPLVDITNPRGIMIDQASADALAAEQEVAEQPPAPAKPKAQTKPATPDRRRAERR